MFPAKTARKKRPKCLHLFGVRVAARPDSLAVPGKRRLGSVLLLLRRSLALLARCLYAQYTSSASHVVVPFTTHRFHIFSTGQERFMPTHMRLRYGRTFGEDGYASSGTTEPTTFSRVSSDRSRLPVPGVRVHSFPGAVHGLGVVHENVHTSSKQP